MITIRRLVKLYEAGETINDIAARYDLPVSILWRMLAKHYHHEVRQGAQTVDGAESRIQAANDRHASAVRHADRLQAEIDRLREALHASERFTNEAAWRKRARQIAQETSLGRRLQWLDLPLDQELPPEKVIDLRHRGA